MATPGYQAFLLPLLNYLRDGNEHVMAEAIPYLAQVLGLTDEHKRELLPIGQQAKYLNRSWWARTYLWKAGLLDGTSRGRVRITERGQQLLATKPPAIDLRILGDIPEFRVFMGWPP